MENYEQHPEDCTSYPPGSPSPETQSQICKTHQIQPIPLEKQISITPMIEQLRNNPAQDNRQTQSRTDEERMYSLMSKINPNPQQPTGHMEIKPETGSISEDTIYTRKHNLSKSIQKTQSIPIETIDDSIDDDEIIVVDEYVDTEEDPAVKILFMNTDIGRKYRHEIEEFFKSLMRTESRTKQKELLPKIQPRPNFYSLEPNPEAETNPHVLNSTTVIGSVEIHQYWMIDRMGWPMIANTIAHTPGIDLPQYEQHYLNAFPPKEDAVMVEEKPIKTSKSCFNCGGKGHEKSECPKPFDRVTFRKNLQKFKSSGVQYGRYHKGDSNKSMKPGVISDGLRNALGLREDEIPSHIYRMRELGYPPGWLQTAEVNNSGLAMFDMHGREVDLDGDLMEDGQVPEHRMRDENRLLYNADDLIEFPGFNIPAEEGLVDYAGRGYPRMKPDQSLENMKRRLLTIQREDPHGEKKRGHSGSSHDDPSRSKRRRLVQHHDMDLSDEEQGTSMPIEVINIEDDDLPPPPPPEEEPAPSDDDEPEDMNYIETISALEAEKQKILAELGEVDEVTSTPDGQGPSSRLGGNSKGIPLDMDDEETVHTQNNSTLGQSMSYQMCTPIVVAPCDNNYSNLPDIDRFADGIAEHLPFENLPTSTGKFEKMSAVMKNVKEKLAKIRPQKKKINKKM